MNPFSKFVRVVRAHPRIALGVLAGLGLAYALLVLNAKAVQETDARKSAEVLVFEKNADLWLARQRNASEFKKALDDKNLSSVALVPSVPGLVLYTLKDGFKASSSVPGCSIISCAGTVLDKLGEQAAKGGFSLVKVEVDPRTVSRRLLDTIMALLAPLGTIAVMVVALVLIMKMQTGVGGAASRLSKRPVTRFTDVIGNNEAKAALNRVSAFMKDPAHYARLGAKAPRGVLLVGAPGLGKTLLAQALAGESKANFISVDGSYFTAMFYGAGVSKVKDLFKLARRNAPCVIFIDEIDGIGKRTTGGSNSGGESESNRIINRVLVEMDGFDALDNVVVVAATNHEDNLDVAMRRAGRFDMLVRLHLPTLPERQKIFDLYLGKVVTYGTRDTASLARMTSGMSPADIANVVNKAASSAAEAKAQYVTHEHVLRAIETQQLGGEVSAVKDLLSEPTRERLAYHEAGHALMGYWLNAGLVERVTIEPRGAALGVTYITRETEDPLYRENELTSRLAMMLGGREAELLVFGSVSTGASDDLKKASELAINMVGSLGFSRAFGLLSVAGIPKELLGPDIQAAVLTEARHLLETGQSTCHQMLRDNRGTLDALARRLLELEVLAGDELKALLAPAVALDGVS